MRTDVGPHGLIHFLTSTFVAMPHEIDPNLERVEERQAEARQFIASLKTDGQRVTYSGTAGALRYQLSLPPPWLELQPGILSLGNYIQLICCPLDLPACTPEQRVSPRAAHEAVRKNFEPIRNPHVTEIEHGGRPWVEGRFEAEVDGHERTVLEWLTVEPEGGIVLRAFVEPALADELAPLIRETFARLRLLTLSELKMEQAAAGKAALKK